MATEKYAKRKKLTKIAELLSKELGVPVEIRDQDIIACAGHLICLQYGHPFARDISSNGRRY